MNNIALVIDTNSRYSDVWAPCFGRLKQFCPNTIKKYVCVDKGFEQRKHTVCSIPDGFATILYDDNQTYRNQFLYCLKQIEEEFILYTSEDYILFNFVDEEKIKYILDVLSQGSFSFVKLTKGPEEVSLYNGHDNLFVIDPNSNNFFAQQAAIWRTRDFQYIFEASPPSNGRMEQEPGGSAVCRSIGLNKGLQYYDSEQKRGLFHYDSSVFPHIATAIVKGKWNMSEYPSELRKVIDEYQIDINIRGVS